MDYEGYDNGSPERRPAQRRGDQRPDPSYHSRPAGTPAQPTPNRARQQHRPRSEQEAAERPRYPQERQRVANPQASPYARSAYGRSAYDRPRTPSGSQAGGREARSRSGQPARAGHPEQRRNAGYGNTRNQRNPRQGSPEAAPYQDRSRYTARTAKPQKSPLRKLATIGIVAAAAAVLVFGGVMFAQAQPARVTINGQEYEIGGDKTIAEAFKVTGITAKPGDLVAVDGSVLEAGRGKPFSATVNGTPVEDEAKKLASGDVVELGDGGPLEEPSDAIETPIPWSVTEEGNGPIHVIEGEGKDGISATKTGKTSGITAEQVTQEPSNIVRRNLTPDVGDDKVIALTFDDGPWGKQTGEVLDVLKHHGAKATFFTVGSRIEEGDGSSFVKRAASEGHQICTHSYDHAAGSGQGVNLGYMTPEEQKAEIEKGYRAIEAVTGGEASRIIRTPGGNFDEGVAKNIGPLIKAEIGWNIDSGDWRKPGADAIAREIEDAWSGSIILMHDGGGDRSQTIEALKTALPRLKDKGYRFVTIDELMQYPLVAG